MLFSKLVEAISPKQVLSAQAVAVLIQFENSLASEMLEMGMYAQGNLYMFIDGLQGQYKLYRAKIYSRRFGKVIRIGFATAT